MLRVFVVEELVRLVHLDRQEVVQDDCASQAQIGRVQRRCAHAPLKSGHADAKASIEALLTRRSLKQPSKTTATLAAVPRGRVRNCHHRATHHEQCRVPRHGGVL